MHETVYYVFLSVMYLSLFVLLENASRISLKWFLAIVLVPPLLALFILRNFTLTRAALFFFLASGAIIYSLEIVSGYTYVDRLMGVMEVTFMWPYFAWQYLLPYLQPTSVGQTY